MEPRPVVSAFNECRIPVYIMFDVLSKCVLFFLVVLGFRDAASIKVVLAQTQ